MGPRCTTQFLAYTAAGAIFQLASHVTLFDFGPGTEAPTIEFTLEDKGVGTVLGKVQMVTVDDEFSVVSITAHTSGGQALLDHTTFTPVLCDAFQADTDSRRIVEMSAAAGSLSYRFDRSLFNQVTA